MAPERLTDDKKINLNKSKADQTPDKQAAEGNSLAAGLTHLQQQVGNQAVQRLLAQRSGDGAFTLDDETTGRINQARGGGQALDSTLQTQMGEQMGHDFNDVRVHTSGESDALNQELGAKAFTTGRDIFFKEGAYQPGSSSGQELIAHELTHVVQQSSGLVGGGSQMTVNAPDDAYEQEADAVAKSVTEVGSDSVQRQELPEEEELQMKRDDAIQRQEVPEEEEELMLKADDAVQRQDELEEDEL